ncbi:conserved membrane hypothetical protein [metagenome]|uniref:VanZ-like domain-containing protein n=1 Tax=metagenome TaxID=256318 RepID=A0A2P2BYM1_9ZZZZ
MVPVGGVGVMLAGAVGALALLALAAWGLRRRVGWPVALAWTGLCWWLVVIALVTLVPANGAPGVVPAEGRLPTCSWDIGGPAPDGFWVFDGGQRLLNTVLFVPAGLLLVLAVSFRRSGWLLAPLGLVALAGYSALIEWVQLELARIDRACDVTDVVDNVTGAVLGFAAGLIVITVLALVRAPRD